MQGFSREAEANRVHLLDGPRHESGRDGAPPRRCAPSSSPSSPRIVARHAGYGSRVETAEYAFDHIDPHFAGVHIDSSKSERHTTREVTSQTTNARDELVRNAAARGTYAPLYRHLASISASPEWRATFGKLEAILGFRLPDSARLYRPWWSNQNRGAGHSHALSWHAAGWKTRLGEKSSPATGTGRAGAAGG